MAIIDEDTAFKKNRKKHRKGKKTISFDSEVVTKEQADEIMESVKQAVLTKPRESKTQAEPSVERDEGEKTQEPKKKKRKRNAEKPPVTTETPTQDELDPKKPEIKSEESIRARKRRKYTALLLEKKTTAELAMQQKCLNYLSMWKHSRAQWKFEKLKQIWLIDGMYDDAKVPDEFWGTLVDYLNGSQGKVRGSVIKGALKIIDGAEEAGDETVVGGDGSANLNVADGGSTKLNVAEDASTKLKAADGGSTKLNVAEDASTKLNAADGVSTKLNVADDDSTKLNAGEDVAKEIDGENNVKYECNVKYLRARTIIQSLQE